MTLTVDEQFWWYLSRSSGIVAWALLTAAVLLGLVVRTKVGASPAKPPWWLDLHRHIGGLATIFTGFHIGALVADSYVHFGIAEILLPLASTWKPGPVAAGVIALWLIAAIEVSSLLQKRLPRTVWRRVHLTSYPLFWIATGHYLAAGTDAESRWTMGAVFVAAGLVLFLTVTRLLLPKRGANRIPRVPPAPAPAS